MFRISRAAESLICCALAVSCNSKTAGAARPAVEVQQVSVPDGPSRAALDRLTALVGQHSEKDVRAAFSEHFLTGLSVERVRSLLDAVHRDVGRCESYRV